MPLTVRVVVTAVAAVFVYGTAVHLDQLAAGGWNPYRELPGWLAGYFVSLTVLDPIAAGLLAFQALGRRAPAGPPKAEAERWRLPAAPLAAPP